MKRLLCDVLVWISIGRSMGGMNEGSFNSFTDCCRVNVVIARMTCQSNMVKQ